MVNKSKRSQSEVITIVLIILLVLAAVFIVYVVIRNMIKSGTEQANISPLDVSLTTFSTSLSQSQVNVSVSRGAGAGNISAIKIIFRGANGESYTYTNTVNLPGELETKVYSINQSEIGFVPVSYEVYPVIRSGNGEIIGLKATQSSGSINANAGGNNGGGSQDLYYKDADGDGYSDGTSNLTRLAGYNTSAELNGHISGDCNDNDAGMNPGASETYNNGIDENCDGGDNLNACGTISIGNVLYKLDNDLSAGLNQDCFTINADNVTLDLKGNEIKGTVNENVWCSSNYNGEYEGTCNSYSSISECSSYYNCNGWDGESGVSCADYAGDENACNSHSSGGCWWDMACYGNSYTDTSNNGVYSSGFGNLKILNGKISYFGSAGIYLANTNQQNSIKNISITGFIDSFGSKYGQCVMLQSSNQNVVEDSDIDNCSIGVYTYLSSNNRFVGNEIDATDYGFYVYQSNNNTLFNNQISNPYMGIYVYGSQKNNVTGNRLNGPISYAGVYNYLSNNNTFIGNYACNSSSYDFYCYNSNNTFISNNCASSKIQGCGAGLACSAC